MSQNERFNNKQQQLTLQRLPNDQNNEEFWRSKQKGSLISAKLTAKATKDTIYTAQLTKQAANDLQQ